MCRGLDCVGKKKKKEKERERERDRERDDRTNRPLPSRKLPAARASTASVGEFDDDVLFGLSTTRKVSGSMSASAAPADTGRGRSMSRSSITRDWDEGGSEEDVAGARSGESTARKVSASMRAKERADQQRSAAPSPAPAPAASLPDPPPVQLVVDEPPHARTFGSRRRAASNASGSAAPSANPTPAASPAPMLPGVGANPPALSMPPLHEAGREQPASVTFAPPAAAPAAFFMPSDPDPEPESAPMPAPATVPAAAAAPAVVSPTAAALPVAAAEPVAEGSRADSPPPASDPFGDLMDPMADIDDTGGNRESCIEHRAAD